jgi:hypothetical protein
MVKKYQNPITHWLKVIIIGVVFGFALQFVRAWTEPTQAPPGGNVGAPINTSGNTQTKAGTLSVGGLWSPSLYDSENGSYYLNPNGNSRLNELYSEGNIQTGAWLVGSLWSGHICLNGSCIDNWPASAPPCTCQIILAGSGLDCSSTYYQWCPWGGGQVGQIYYHASCAGSGGVNFPCS